MPCWESAIRAGCAAEREGTLPSLLPRPGVRVHPGSGRVPTHAYPPPGRGCSGTEGLSSPPQPCHCPQEREEGRTCATATCVCCCCCCRSCWRSCIWWWAERGVPRSGSWAEEGSSILGDAVRISSGWRQPCKKMMSKVRSRAPCHRELLGTNGLWHRAAPQNAQERRCCVQSKHTLCWGC